MKFTIGTKKEMTQIFDAEGNVQPITIVDIADTRVVGIRTEAKDGYNAVILGAGLKKNTTKAESEKFKKSGDTPVKSAEFRVDSVGEDIQEGAAVQLDIEPGDKINITGVTKGKGFAGVVKRWGFKGGPKTHGQSDRHRAPGSIGSGTTPGRVYKGKRMGGRMGGVNKTVENLKVVKYDKDSGLLYVKGAVPGAKSGYLLITI